MQLFFFSVNSSSVRRTASQPSLFIATADDATFIVLSFFSSPEPLGSQGELIVYPSSWHPSVGVVHNAQIFSETAGPIKSKFYMEPPWVGGTIFCSRHLGHMTKMAATPKYGKNPSKISFSRTSGPIFTKLGM